MTDEQRERANARQREKYRTDPEYKERVKARNIAWAAANPEKVKARLREYWQRPEVKKHKAEYQRAYAAAHPEKIQAIIDRRAADPERQARFIAWRKAYYKEYRKRKKAENVVPGNKP